MSRTTALGILCLTIALGFAFSYVGLPTSEKKLIFNQQTAASRLGITNKLNSGVSITISPANDDKMEANKDFGLNVEVQAPIHLKDVKVAWGFPTNVTLVSGDNQFTIPELKPGEPQHFQIVIRNPSSDNVLVHVRVMADNNGQRFREIAQYNTVNQKEIDEQKADLAKRTLKAIENGQGSRLKIYK